MADEIIRISDDFWNVRGSFKIGGLLDIGTQCSLVAMPDGGFVLLDSYEMTDDVLRDVMSRTDGGSAVRAILNLHPYHTLHCEASHRQFPVAKLYGSTRHKQIWPDLPWERENVEDASVAEQFAPILDFSMPQGVDYISADPDVHFSSLLALHRPSGTLHVDDTLTYFDLSLPWRLFLPARLAFHPRLAPALEKRAGATRDFRNWAHELAREWSEVRHVCAAHRGVMAVSGEFPERLETALKRIEPVLAKHEKAHG